MRRYFLIAGIVLLMVLLLGGTWFAAPLRGAEAGPEMMVIKNLCAFPILVEIRDDAVGMLDTASCPPLGTDMVPALWRGGRTVTVWNTETGAMLTHRHVVVGDMHREMHIHPNGDVTLHAHI